MDSQPSFVIGSLPGYAPAIGQLVGMMTYARWTTIRAVDGLTTPQLDHLHDESSNSIGALLTHIAAVEVAYQRITFDGKGFASAHDAELAVGLQLGDGARAQLRGKSLAHYLALLDSVRQNTVRELAARTDRWLQEQSPFWSGKPANNYFKWFHVFEDELNHRGQIRWLRHRLPAS